jgi:hypothetical protein
MSARCTRRRCRAFLRRPCPSIPRNFTST